MKPEDSVEYHLRELAIATSKSDERRSVPVILPEHRRILDVGCGIGQLLVALDLDAGIEAYGIDVDKAAVRYGVESFPGLRLLVSAGEALPFPDAHFDLIMCRVALPYMHIPRTLSEFSRVLRDHGSVWMSIHPMSRFVGDMGAALANIAPRKIVYLSYVLINSLLLSICKQVRYPLNHSRTESYQMQSAIRRNLESVGFGSVSFARDHRSSIVQAVRLARGKDD